MASDLIHLKDLRVRGIIGIHPWEREKPQDLVVHMTCEVDLELAARSDEIGDTISYGALSRAIVKHVQTEQHFLIEKLARELARIAVEQGADRVRVRIDKPWAVEGACAAVEIERGREDFA